MHADRHISILLGSALSKMIVIASRRGSFLCQCFQNEPAASPLVSTAGRPALRTAGFRRQPMGLIAALLATALRLGTAKAGVFDNGTAVPHIFGEPIVVTEQAMGARCVVAADLDGDGRQDLISASSNDNAVSWFRNEGPASADDRRPAFSIKREITWSSLGSRIVTVADVDGDGDIDVVGASYYDSTLRWFENDGTGGFTPHVISATVNEGQGVTMADVDNDGDADVISASSGDNTIAVFRNLGGGVFCEIREVVDDAAVGARTVVAADLNGDGWMDLVAASKDDDTVAWYPNDGAGHFREKIVVSRGEESKGAYSLVAKDVDGDGDQDLVVASNGNDQVSLWRNDGNGNFTKTLIYGAADFVLSVTAVDFDRDGDIDVASASFYDGHINWYENVDGLGYEWRNHTIYVGISGHYVSHADMDGDGDDDLLAALHADNTVAVFLAGTACDGAAAPRACCRTDAPWNGTACAACAAGTYGTGTGAAATCVACPASCTVRGLDAVPVTCAGITGCNDPAAGVARCSCLENHVRDPKTSDCIPCPEGQLRPDSDTGRGLDTLDNYALWEAEQGVCRIMWLEVNMNYIGPRLRVGGLVLCAIILALSLGFAIWTKYYENTHVVRASQPIFLYNICLGCFLMGGAIIPLSIDDEVASESRCAVACMAAPYLVCIGWVLVFTALFTKMWRVNRVFTNSQALGKIKIKNADVIKIGIGTLFVNALILVLWTKLSPLVWKRESVNGVSIGSCESDGAMPYAVTLLVIDLSTMFVALFQCWKARRVSIELAESTYIAAAIALIIVVCFVGIPVSIIASNQPRAHFFVVASIIFVLCTSLLLFIFVPKEKYRRENRNMTEVINSSWMQRPSQIIRLESNENVARLQNRESNENKKGRNSELSRLESQGLMVLNSPQTVKELEIKVDNLLSEINELQAENNELKGLTSHDHGGEVNENK